MARQKVTIGDIRKSFEKARHLLGEDAQLLSSGEDYGKAILINHGEGVVYSCSTLQGHLEFLVQHLDEDDPFGVESDRDEDEEKANPARDWRAPDGIPLLEARGIK